ncbi:MAG: hypothetical protein RLY86_1394 [Pseudomonadota bacterium]|jgi:hypothetical protein
MIPVVQHPRDDSLPPGPVPVPGPVGLRAPDWLTRLFGVNRRRSPRIALAGGTARVEGMVLTVADLSRGGMRLTGYRGLLDRQDRFPFVLALPIPGPDLAGEAVVVWRQGDRMGAAFYALSAEARTHIDRALTAHPDGAAVRRG